MKDKHTSTTYPGRAPALAHISSFITMLLIIDVVLVYLPAAVAAIGGAA